MFEHYSIFSYYLTFASESQITETANAVLKTLQDKYGHLWLKWESHGIILVDVNEADLGGFTQEEVQNNLTEEFIREMNLRLSPNE